MSRIKELQIKDHKCEIQLFGGTESFKIAHNLQEKVLPSISNIFGAIDSGNPGDILKSKIKFDFIKKGIEDLYKNIGDEEQAFKLIKRILSGVTVYGQDINDKIYRLKNDNDFDDFFAGRFELVYIFVYEVLKINYPFFSEKISKLLDIFRTTDFTSLINQNSEELTEKSDESQNLTDNIEQNGHTGGSFLANILARQS